MFPLEWEPPEAGAPFPLRAAEALEDWIFSGSRQYRFRVQVIGPGLGLNFNPKDTAKPGESFRYPSICILYLSCSIFFSKFEQLQTVKLQQPLSDRKRWKLPSKNGDRLSLSIGVVLPVPTVQLLSSDLPISSSAQQRLQKESRRREKGQLPHAAPKQTHWSSVPRAAYQHGNHQQHQPHLLQVLRHGFLINWVYIFFYCNCWHAAGIVWCWAYSSDLSRNLSPSKDSSSSSNYLYVWPYGSVIGFSALT